MIQIDGIKHQVHIKFTDTKQADALVKGTNGNVPYVHTDGTILLVLIDHASMGFSTVQIANLPPELPNDTIKLALGQCGTILALKTKYDPLYRDTPSEMVFEF
jgi:hypothetical protein